MIQLYFEEYNVDLAKDLQIPMTYQNIDLSQPEAKLNSYSKTVSIVGTPNNNKIFGSIYRFDKSITEMADSFIGVDYDPNKRVNYTILNNGILFDRGYFKLDKINVDKGKIVYDITLYGGIGNFFYSLMYDENGNDRNLGSLHYGISSLGINEENTQPILEYNKDFVNKAWNTRLQTYLFDHIPDTNVEKMFCPIPSYSGLYNDFKSDIILQNTKFDYGSFYKFPTVFKEGNKQEDPDNYKEYRSMKDWIKIQTPRELTEWEAGDIRSHYQRLGVRIKNIYEAIKDPANNGGFEVDDSNVEDIEKQYINYAYLMLNRFDYEDINSNFISTSIPLTFNITPHATWFQSYGDSQEFNVQDYLNPNAYINILPELYVNGSDIPDFVQGSYSWAQGYFSVGPLPQIGLYTYGWYSLPGATIRVNLNYQFFYVVGYDQDGNQTTQSDIYFYGGNSAGTAMRRDEPAETYYQQCKQLIENDLQNVLGLKSSLKFNYAYSDKGYDLELQSTATTKKFLGKSSIPIKTKLTNTTVKLRVYAGVIYGFVKYVNNNSSENKSYVGYKFGFYNEGVTKEYQDTTSIANIGNSQTSQTAVFDGDYEAEAERHVLNKRAIFNGTTSPYSFLLNLGKMFNWRFEQDILSGKVMIYSARNYYNGITRVIEDDIDRSKYDIIPTTAEYKCYDFGNEVVDTYAKNLWDLKYSEDYGKHHLATNYEFSKEHYDMFESSDFQTLIPWKLSSVYFNEVPLGWVKGALGSKFYLTLWSEDGNDSKEEKITGYSGMTKLPEGQKRLDQYRQDVFAKLCSFDKDNSVVDSKNAIVYFDYYRSYHQDIGFYQISDNIPICQELADQNCYYLCNGSDIYASLDSPEEKKTTDLVFKVPVFSNKFDYYNQNYFGLYQTPYNDVNLQEDRSNNYPCHNLYELCYKFISEDLYNKNNKVVNIKYRLRDIPQEAMKRFYYFDNCTWILNKIEDYNPGFNNFTKCQFIKIQDKSNYSNK